jgi:magnesium chelatase accessory protein
MSKLDFAKDGADWPNRDASRFVNAAGFRWHVQIFGNGPPMLLLHGTGASTHSWRRIAAYLENRFTLIIPDLPGHGFTEDSPSNAFTLPGMASAVGEVVKALSIRPEVVVGHSAGAAVAIRMALDGHIDPQHIVSINGALLPFGGAASNIFSPLAKLLFLNPFVPRFFAWRAQNRTAVSRLLRDTGANVSDEDIDFYAMLFSSPNHCAAALAMMARWDLPSLVRDMPKLRVPLLLLAGENDRAIPPADAARAAATVPNGKAATVPKAGHLAHEEQPESVAKFIIDVVANTTPAATAAQ